MIHKDDFVELKNILAEVAEQRYKWEDNDDFQTYDACQALLRDISPKHVASLMHYTEKYALHFIASRLSPGSVVVEIGGFLGGSAAVMAHANPTISVISIDQYDTKEHSFHQDQQKMIDGVYGVGKARTLENAKQWIGYNNVHLIEAVSPYDLFQYNVDNKQIDVYFEDAVHSDPGLAANIDYWFPKVVKGGLVIMHDYRPWLPPHLSQPPYRFPDVERHVDQLVKSKYTEILVHVRGLIVLKKLV
jgi:hypothetical protein